MVPGNAVAKENPYLPFSLLPIMVSIGTTGLQREIDHQSSVELALVQRELLQTDTWSSESSLTCCSGREISWPATFDWIRNIPIRYKLEMRSCTAYKFPL